MLIAIIAFILIDLLTCDIKAWKTDFAACMQQSFWLFSMFVTIVLMYRLAAGAERARSIKTAIVISIPIIVHLSIMALLVSTIKQYPNSYHLIGLILPYMLAPMVVCILLGSHLGVVATVAVSLLGVAIVPEALNLNYMSISLIAGLVTTMLTRRVRKRGQILRAGCIVGLLVLVLALILGMICNTAETDKTLVLLEIICAFSGSIVIAIIVGGILPAIEGIFHIITPISWLELGDMNHPLLKRLQLEAPGTFHHSIVVARLAEAAAEAIGANATRCHVCAYYHDIGKLKYPQYFAENIQDYSKSEHNELTPAMSARIIIGHVAEGVTFAEAYKLNATIKNVIKEHHGTSLAYYFYRKALDQQKEMQENVAAGKASPDDVPVVDESLFRYSGPIPQSRESGIVSLADAVESATRSLTDPTAEDIDEMIDSVIRGRILDGHLVDSQLTFGDVRKIRNSFSANLKGSAHHRIAYPRDPSNVEYKPNAK